MCHDSPNIYKQKTTNQQARLGASEHFLGPTLCDTRKNKINARIT